MLIKTLGIGGAERHVVDLSLDLKARGYDVTVCFVDVEADEFRPELEAGGVEVLCLSGSSGLPSIVRNMIKVFRTHKPDVVHVHSPRLKVMARILRPFFTYRLISTYHNTFSRHHPAIRAVEILSHWVDDALISCSPEVAKTMTWRTEVVPNGIRLPKPAHGEVDELRQRLGLAGSDLIFTCVANLLHKKNHAGLLAAFAEAFKASAETHLVLFGEGDQRARLERQISDLGLVNRVHLMGADPEAACLIVGADVFCLVSFHEGLPLALLEAMSKGLPSIVSKAGGMPGVVRNGETGLIVDATDTAAIANAMRELASDNDKRWKLGRAGSQHIVEKYQIGVMVDRIEDVYQRALAGD